jgi:hypothetical protein
MMVPRAPPVVTPPLVFRTDWKTLVRLTFTWSKPLDLEACPAPTSLRQFCGATDKSKPTWFWGPNQETITVILRPKPRNHHGDFKPQITKSELPVLSPKPGNPPPPWFWGQTGRDRLHQFWGQTGENRRHWFWGQTRENHLHWFWGQTRENRRNRIWGQTARNRRSRFWGQTVRNRRHRFWGQTGENRLSCFVAKRVTYCQP